MTRDEAMLKLLALEPATEHQMLLETGWPPAEVRATLERLRASRQVTYANRGNCMRYMRTDMTAQARQRAGRC